MALCGRPNVISHEHFWRFGFLALWYCEARIKEHFSNFYIPRKVHRRSTHWRNWWITIIPFMQRNSYTKCYMMIHHVRGISTCHNHRFIDRFDKYAFIFSLKEFDLSFDIMNTQKTQQPPGVLIGTLDMVEYNNILHYKKGILMPSKRRIYLSPLAIFFQKYSCLVPTFNKYIEMLHTGGFIQIWSRIYQKLSLRHLDKHLAPKQISIEQIGGIYIITTYAYAICLLVFFVELLSLKIKFLQNLFKYL